MYAFSTAMVVMTTMRGARSRTSRPGPGAGRVRGLAVAEERRDGADDEHEQQEPGTTRMASARLKRDLRSIRVPLTTKKIGHQHAEPDALQLVAEDRRRVGVVLLVVVLRSAAIRTTTPAANARAGCRCRTGRDGDARTSMNSRVIRTGSWSWPGGPCAGR
jgi:hypothetical protein